MAVGAYISVCLLYTSSETTAKPPVGKKPIKAALKTGPLIPHEELAPKVVPQLIAALSDGSAEAVSYTHLAQAAAVRLTENPDR